MKKMPHLATETLRLRQEGRTFKQICAHLAKLGYYSSNGNSLYAHSSPPCVLLSRLSAF